MKIKLGEQAKTEFIEHISKQSIKCWFDGDELIMPSGQGRASKGIVLYQLQVWQLKQAEIDEKDKRIAELEKKLNAVHALARMRSAVITADRWSPLRPHIKKAIKCLDMKEKALRGCQ